jgi:tetratricopeptide (TPR) repeat protein
VRLKLAAERHDHDNELGLAEVTRAAADLERGAGWAAVEAAYRDARGRLERLHAAEPSDLAVARELAVVEQRLGFAASERGDPAAAEAAFASAAKRLGGVVATGIGDADVVMDSVQVDRTWASALQRTGSAGEAPAVMLGALRRLEDLLRQAPARGAAHGIRSDLLSDLAGMAVGEENRPLAILLNEESVAAASTAADLAPRGADELAALGEAHRRLALALAAAQRRDEAVVHLGRAVAALALAATTDAERVPGLASALATLEAEAATADALQASRARAWVAAALQSEDARAGSLPVEVRERLTRFAGAALVAPPEPP